MATSPARTVGARKPLSDLKTFMKLTPSRAARISSAALNPTSALTSTLRNSNQLLRIAIRQWLQKHAIDDRKDGGIGADTQCQHENAQGAEEWLPRQVAGCLFPLLQKIHR